MFFKSAVKLKVKKHVTFVVLKATSRISPVIVFSYTKSTNKLNLYDDDEHNSFNFNLKKNDDEFKNGNKSTILSLFLNKKLLTYYF